MPSFRRLEEVRDWVAHWSYSGSMNDLEKLGEVVRKRIEEKRKAEENRKSKQRPLPKVEKARKLRK